MFETGKASIHLIMDGADSGEDIKASDVLLAGRGGLYAFSLMSGGMPAAGLMARGLKSSIKDTQAEEKLEKSIDARVKKLKEEAIERGDRVNPVKLRMEAKMQEDRENYKKSITPKTANLTLRQRKEIKEKMEEWDKRKRKID